MLVSVIIPFSQLQYDYDSTAIKNLNCIYSNIGSYELLSKLWDTQIAASPRDHKILASQADAALAGSLVSIATSKYTKAATLAMENFDYDQAIRSSAFTPY